MSSFRVGQARKRDANEAGIITALERYGARGLKISAPGAPDLLVSFKSGNRRELALLEIKAHRGRQTAAQLAFEKQGWTVFLVRSVSEALKVIGVEC